MKSDIEHDIRLKGQRLADLKNQAEELERQLSGARLLLASDEPGARVPERDERTEALVNHGRASASPRSHPHAALIAAAAAVAVVLATIAVTALSGAGASWPASVAAMQGESASACRNSNVASEPNQVNFACGKDTRQILWVLALLTSGGNPKFADPVTGRLGLEPITPAQGGAVAWSLNLHQPYNPLSPVDSLAVAARAINNIIGGATVTATDGHPVAEPGLESEPANCARYTGSAAVIAHQGYPAMCARPVTSQAGQAALVIDVFHKWAVAAPAQAARDAAVLFQNSQNPGASPVQAILRHLAAAHPSW